VEQALRQQHQRQQQQQQLQVRMMRLFFPAGEREATAEKNSAISTMAPSSLSSPREKKPLPPPKKSHNSLGVARRLHPG
jgi:hypothetical protein